MTLLDKYSGKKSVCLEARKIFTHLPTTPDTLKSEEQQWWQKTHSLKYVILIRRVY